MDAPYRRNHTPDGLQKSTEAPDVLASHSFRRDENGAYYYWNERRQTRRYGVYVGACIGCGIAFLTRHKTRDKYCTNSCAATHRVHPKGDQCYQWKGGRYVTAKGYVLVYRPDHPTATKRGYVMEHRLVMEERLGRFLRPGENVHHINGVKGDNRDENLELWVTSQPSGQRPEDMVAWAKRVMEMYAAEDSEEAPAA